MTTSILKTKKTNKRLRYMTWSIVFIVFCSMTLPMTGYLFTNSETEALAQQSAGETNQRSNFWRAVRGGGSGYSSVVGSDVNTETNMLYNITGQDWRQIRNSWIAEYGGWSLFAVLLLIVAFFSLRGRIELSEPASGERVKRWSLPERMLHWYTAILFICLAITGLSLLFGRAILIPLMGPEGFALWASFAIALHNFAGPFFAVGPLLMFILWVRHNLPHSTDIAWFAQGGGIVGKKHPSAGKANAGEKVWFWIVIFLGLGAVCFTGFALIGWVQEYFGQELTRALAQQMHIWHTVSALLWIAIFLGHAYIGTIGSEGSIDAMTKGHVSAEWAKQHHDLWYEEVTTAEADEEQSESMERSQAT